MISFNMFSDQLMILFVWRIIFTSAVCTGNTSVSSNVINKLQQHSVAAVTQRTQEKFLTNRYTCSSISLQTEGIVTRSRSPSFIAIRSFVAHKVSLYMAG